MTASRHGIERLADEFNIVDTLAEFRALRASVMKLWGRSTGTLAESESEELTRFNEAIDQAILESAMGYAEEKEGHTRLLATILRTSPDPICVLDRKHRLVYANQAMQELYGLSRPDLVGRYLLDVDESLPTEFRQHLQHTADSGRACRGELSMVPPDGQQRSFEYLLTPVLDGKEIMKSTVAYFWDVTERKTAEEKIWHIANHDLLTGLPNRRLFFEQLTQEARRAPACRLPPCTLTLTVSSQSTTHAGMTWGTACCAARRSV